MKKIEHLDVVCAVLSAAVTHKTDYSTASGDTEAIQKNAIETFKSIYRQLDHFNNEII